MNEFWDKILEQNKVKKILQELIEKKRVPHAFIFSGQEGIGKFNTALQFSKVLYSNTNQDFNVSVYSKLDNFQEPYLKLIFPLPRGRGETADDSATEKLTKDQLELIHEEIHRKANNPYHKLTIEKANTIKINSIREIKKFITIGYGEISYRFIFIVDAHLMNEQAQNALLRNLEEPPEGIYFFLITFEKEKLLPTIQSRCWDIEFEPLSNNAIENLLITMFDVDTSLAKKVSLFSEGSLINVLNILKNDFDNTLENVISILRYSLAHRYYSAYKDLNSLMSNKSHDELKQTMRLIRVWVNDVLKNQHSVKNYYFFDFIDTLEKFNEKFQKTKLDQLYNRLDLLEDSIDKNLNLNVLTLNLIFELSSLSIRK